MQSRLEHKQGSTSLFYFCSFLCGIGMIFSGCDGASNQKKSLDLNRNTPAFFEEDTGLDYSQIDLSSSDMMIRYDHFMINMHYCNCVCS